MTLHPILELLLNPLASPAGFNLISAGFYFTLAILAILAITEHSFHNHKR